MKYDFYMAFAHTQTHTAYLITNDKYKEATTCMYLIVQSMMPKTYEAKNLIHLHETITGI